MKRNVNLVIWQISSLQFLGKTITDHDPIFFRNTSMKRGSWSGSFFQDPQKRDFTFCDCDFRSTTWVRIMLKMIQNYQIYQNYVDSRKNDPDHDPLFILVFLKKIGSWSVIVLPKNSINWSSIITTVGVSSTDYGWHEVNGDDINWSLVPQYPTCQSINLWDYFRLYDYTPQEVNFYLGEVENLGKHLKVKWFKELF